MLLVKSIKKGKRGIFLCSYCEQIIERHLTAGKKSKSCGCMQHFYSHHGTGTRLFKIWQGIKKRCLNSVCARFKDYGGRGITICREWLNDFGTFRQWALANGYQDDLIIDRIDNDGNYESSNCRWATIIQSNRNSRNAKLNGKKADEIKAKYKTGKYTMRQLGREYGVARPTIGAVIHNKTWSDLTC